MSAVLAHINDEVKAATHDFFDCDVELNNFLDMYNYIVKHAQSDCDNKKASKNSDHPYLAFTFQFTWKYDILIISTMFEAMIKERTC